jgi:hypothetical protein
LAKKQNMYGARAEGGALQDDGRFDLENMMLDRNDQGLNGDLYDPFLKNNVSLVMCYSDRKWT